MLECMSIKDNGFIFMILHNYVMPSTIAISISVSHGQ